MKTSAIALFLASLTATQAFTAVPAPKATTSLQAAGFSYTGGTQGSSMVSHRQLDKDAPWGSHNPNLLYNNKSAYYQNSRNRQFREAPGTTGGTGGSTLVSDFIQQDSIHAPNYHHVQQYGRHQQLATRGGYNYDEYEQSRYSRVNPASRETQTTFGDQRRQYQNTQGTERRMAGAQQRQREQQQQQRQYQR